MKVIFKCNICNRIIEKNIKKRKDNIDKTERIYKCTNECKRIRYFIGSYKRKIDIFKIFNPIYWLNFYNNDPIKTINHLQELKYLQKYFNPKSNVYLPVIINKVGLQEYLLTNLLNRIKNNKIDLNEIKKYNNLNSINRWKSLGFNDNESKKLSEYFKTSKEGFLLRDKSIDDYNKWKLKSIINRGGVPSKNENPLFREYWIDNGYSYKEATNIISKKNRRDLNYFINKYGVDKGTVKYNNMCTKRRESSSLKGYINKYGYEEGKRKFDKINDSKNISLKNQIKRYGIIIGTEKHNNRVKKMLASYSKNDFNSGSKIANLFFDSLKISLNLNIDKEVIIDKYICDCFIEEKKLIIEFFGDYWHKNPLRYNEYKKYSSYDQRKINFLKERYNVIIIWEACMKNIESTLLIIQENLNKNIFNFEINLNKKNEFVISNI